MSPEGGPADLNYPQFISFFKGSQSQYWKCKTDKIKTDVDPLHFVNWSSFVKSDPEFR